MRKAESGFTLMEILIALTILMIGIVGILALFPPGLVSSKSAIEDSTAAIIAESVHGSLKTAFKGASPAGTATWQTAPFVHDGVAAGYQIPLPEPGAGTSNFPSSTGVWWVGRNTGAGVTRSDEDRDALNQYCFDLVIDYPASGGTPTVTGLFDVQIRIFRNFKGTNKNANINGVGMRPTLLKVFYTQIGVN